ncbi:MAG: ADP-forming succinate--CoA ligase subunit beta [Lentimicrobiaceae bacterium]|jgi:succinyl-CoA synthetase beta subunit|nr:ADP-forming succinate--CoA ligase subunit beta [Lentimicrobiaceae bacterium]MCP4909281.1 ADP-forming succinate--CoA ligase subunit beta [Bacteroidota bacterium]MBT3455028.1 ADP-forming succinate--CoA ligase subunit beta [Lentimicrobiaceae bacterium]MBT3818671.1 ADP-forming succinate--CoA ligase subunit beta [Lentimicrobiaceae bacterium]MBT4060402.1 ADP-forming succinate--CoA ligase subunit beta [Lentimicrobiaceae bacterium]
MNLHEYQGKSILKDFGVMVPDGIIANSPEAAYEAAKEIQGRTGSKKWAVKAQIHAGGRGKGGGVKIASTLKEVRKFADNILGMMLVTPQTKKEGKLVRKVLVEQNIYYPGPEEVEEYYMSILLNRDVGRNMVMYSPRGGMNIEEVAEETPEEIFTEIIDPTVGLTGFQARRIAFNLGLSGVAFKQMTKFVVSLYKAYVGSDSTLFEINPVIKAADGKVYAADSKVVIDNNALYRHKDIAEMRDLSEEDPTEVEASNFDLNFVKLDGNVACMVNGAGLAMATMDMIKMSGGNPANFLDVGGTADAKRVEEAFRIILRDKSVEAILVNIFGGIVRCDRVAQGIVDAYKNIGDIKVPIIVRLQGTNAEEGKKLIDDSGLKVHSAIQLEEAAKLVNTMVN